MSSYKSIIFALVKTAIYKIVYSKILKISIGAIIKDPEMLRLVPDRFTTKKMCKHTFQKLPFLIMFLMDKRLNKCLIKLF